MEVIVDVSAAIICFASACFPALVGNDTPRGKFQLTEYSTDEPGYGGNILAFKRNDKGQVYAIHRIIDVPGQQRLARIKSPYTEHRITITAGCVNVEPEVFDKLIECCYSSKVVIK